MFLGPSKKTSEQSIMLTKFFRWRYLAGFVEMICSLDGQNTSKTPRVLSSAVIHDVNILLTSVFEITNLSDKSLFSRPSLSFINTTRNSSTLVIFRIGPNFCGDDVKLHFILILIITELALHIVFLGLYSCKKIQSNHPF